MTANYDFQTLSSRDFEELGRELLSTKLNINFQIFKDGKDQGIDLLFAADNSKKSLAVQCKRYEPKAFNRLFSVIKRDEVPKIKQANPSRYILFTSVQLSLANKEKLLSVLKPYCFGTQDIYGANDINGLLNDYPEIEKNNYKLWLSSISILEKVLYAKNVTLSNHNIQDLKNKISLFVTNDGVRRAQNILAKSHYCIIAGKPGIGKTTLANLLIYLYIAEGYQVVSISENIDEALNLYSKGKKQVFYYDDFLGQTTLGPTLLKNEDDRLLKFINMLSSSDDSFFILTTREYILNQAAQKYEKLANAKDELQKCILDLEDYTKLDKAQIFCNHVRLSKLSIEKKLLLLEEKIYLKLISHKNYTPRLIEDITLRNYFINEPNENFIKVINDYFDNPSSTWLKAFETLREESKILLFVLTTFPRLTYLPELERAFLRTFARYTDHAKIPHTMAPFRGALRELDGSLIAVKKINKVILSKEIGYLRSQYLDYSIEFENPSIRDFLEYELLNNSIITETLFNSCIYFEQLNFLISTEVGPEQKKLIDNSIISDNFVIDKAFNLVVNRHSSSTLTVQELNTYIYSERCAAKKLMRILYCFPKKSISDMVLADKCNIFIKDIQTYETSARGIVDLIERIKSINKWLEIPISFSRKKIRSIILEKGLSFRDFKHAESYLILSKGDKEELEDEIYDSIFDEVRLYTESDTTTLEELDELEEQISSLIKLFDLDNRIFEDLIYEKREEIEEQDGPNPQDDTIDLERESLLSNKQEDYEVNRLIENLRDELSYCIISK